MSVAWVGLSAGDEFRTVTDDGYELRWVIDEYGIPMCVTPEFLTAEERHRL